jgi:hypothetical protein
MNRGKSVDRPDFVSYASASPRGSAHARLAHLRPDDLGRPEPVRERRDCAVGGDARCVSGTSAGSRRTLRPGKGVGGKARRVAQATGFLTVCALTLLALPPTQAGGGNPYDQQKCDQAKANAEATKNAAGQWFNNFQEKKSSALTLLGTVQAAHIERGHLMTYTQEVLYGHYLTAAFGYMDEGEAYKVDALYEGGLGDGRWQAGVGFYGQCQWMASMECFEWAFDGLLGIPYGARQRYEFAGGHWSSGYYAYHSAVVNLIQAMDQIPFE